MGPSQVNVTILERLCPLDSCVRYISDYGVPFKMEEGTLSSPNFPRSYPNRLNREYEISVSRGKIVINFTSFYTESYNDKLTIRDADGTILLPNHSGRRVPKEIVSVTNRVFLTFTTNRSYTYQGWRLTWHNTIWENNKNPDDCFWLFCFSYFDLNHCDFLRDRLMDLVLKMLLHP